MDELQMHDAMAAGLVSRGLATPQDAADDRAALVTRLNGGEAPEQPSTPAAALTQPPEEPEALDPMMAAAFEGPDSPAGYRFDTPYGMKSDAKQELAFREFFHAEGVPVWAAQEANRLALQGASSPPTPAQLEQGRQQCMVQLEKLYGTEREANLAIAQREVARLAKTRPEIVDILDRTGLGNSPWLVQTLVNLAKAKGRA